MDTPHPILVMFHPNLRREMMTGAQAVIVLPNGQMEHWLILFPAPPLRNLAPFAE